MKNAILDRRTQVRTSEFVTDAENIDIWTPVALQVGVPVEAVEIE